MNENDSANFVSDIVKCFYCLLFSGLISMTEAMRIEYYFY